MRVNMWNLPWNIKLSNEEFFFPTPFIHEHCMHLFFGTKLKTFPNKLLSLNCRWRLWYPIWNNFVWPLCKILLFLWLVNHFMNIYWHKMIILILDEHCVNTCTLYKHQNMRWTLVWHYTMKRLNIDKLVNIKRIKIFT